MEFLQSVLNKVQPPITFRAEISEQEARMTLKELCGSVWDDSPFYGEVFQNSFSFVKQHKTNRKGIPRVALEGDFQEENGKICVTVSPKIRLCDIAGVFLAIFIGAILFILGATGIPVALIALDVETLFSSLFIALFGAGLWVFEYWAISVSFHKSVEIIKTALISAECNRRTLN